MRRSGPGRISGWLCIRRGALTALRLLTSVLARSVEKLGALSAVSTWKPVPDFAPYCL
jgi:hypothetical protein